MSAASAHKEFSAIEFNYWYSRGTIVKNVVHIPMGTILKA